MPVLVTAADYWLARRIAARFLEEGGEVRVTATGDVASLRASGAFVAHVEPDDEGRLEASLAQVHTVVHVGGGLEGDPDLMVDHARVLARACDGAGVARLIALSLPGAATTAADPLRRAKGQVEDIVAATARPSIVLRVGLIDTPHLRDALAAGGLGDEVLDAHIAPVRPDDVAELVVAFDDARSRAERGHLTVTADGPRRLSVASYLDAVGVARVGTGSLVGRRVPDRSRLRRLRDAFRGPWISEDPALLDGWPFAGLSPHPPGAAPTG